jgi:hypothetical protein
VLVRNEGSAGLDAFALYPETMIENSCSMLWPEATSAPPANPSICLAIVLVVVGVMPNIE